MAMKMYRFNNSEDKILVDEKSATKLMQAIAHEVEQKYEGRFHIEFDIYPTVYNRIPENIVYVRVADLTATA